MRTTLMQKEQPCVSVPAWEVPRVARFLASVGFDEAPDAEGAPAHATSFVCNDCVLHLSASRVPDMADACVAIALPVSDPEEVAARCWTEGYTVEVEEQPGEETHLAIVGPCGLRITLERAAR
jgi:hypothetical protein